MHFQRTYPPYYKQRTINIYLKLLQRFTKPITLGYNYVHSFLEILPLEYIKHNKENRNILQQWFDMDEYVARNKEEEGYIKFYLCAKKYKFNEDFHSLEVIDLVDATSDEIFLHVFPYCDNEENDDSLIALRIASKCVEESIRSVHRVKMIHLLQQLLLSHEDKDDEESRERIFHKCCIIICYAKITSADITIPAGTNNTMDLDCMIKILCKYTFESPTTNQILYELKWRALSHMVNFTSQSSNNIIYNYINETIDTGLSNDPVILQSIFKTIQYTIQIKKPKPPERLSIIKPLWMMLNDCTKINNEVMTSFIHCVFQPHVVHYYIDDVQWLFAKFWKYAEPRRPNYVYILVMRLCAIWKLNVKDAVPYMNEIIHILLYDEPEVNLYETIPIERPSDDGRYLVRYVVLDFILENVPCFDPYYQNFMGEIILYLMELHVSKKWKNTKFMIQSELYGYKLRSWQIVCMLSKYISSNISQRLNDILWDVMQENTFQELRHFMEMFAIQLTLRFPQPDLILNILNNYNQTAQITASVLMIIGYVLTHVNEDDEVISNDVQLKWLKAIEPWTMAPHGHTRTIAQYMMFELRHKYQDCCNTFLLKNPEVQKMVMRQKKQFQSINPTITIATLLKTDAVDISIHEHIKQTTKELLIEISNEVNDELIVSNDGIISNKGISNNATNNQQQGWNVQRKITPWDTIEVQMQECESSKRNNAIGRKRQSIILCATLVDKVPNLAGLARTCEIFNVEKLLIPNIKIIQDKMFQQISVTAQKWLPIEELNEKDLMDYLLLYKQQHGYTIIGLEQTSNSCDLTKYEFPDKVILVLGKEKEGIPVELLQCCIIDQCIEIPQFGLLRSLNVHVSGAIMMWEYTKQFLGK